MIIYKCDICDKEFEPIKLPDGNSAYSNFSHYKLTTKLLSGTPTKSLDVSPYMICSDCGDKINDKVKELKKI